MDITSLLLTFAVVIANVFGVGMLIPQTARIVRHRDLAGVSADWIGLGVAVNAGWLAYAWIARVWGLVGVSAGGLILYVAMAIGVRRLDVAPFVRCRTTALIILTALGGVVAIGQEPGLELALAALFTVQFMPAAWSAWTSPIVSGISPTTWVLALGEATIWATYGVVIDDRALLLGGTGASATSALVLVRLWTGANLARDSQQLATRVSLRGHPISNAAPPLLDSDHRSGHGGRRVFEFDRTRRDRPDPTTQ